MNYEEAIAYIEEIPKFTKKNKQSHTRECLNRLGNPDRNFDVVHVAGSNGKGSVCAFTASALMDAGYKVGLFTSPHLVKTNERFCIGGVDVSDEAFLDAFNKVYKMSLELVDEGSYHPTYFEFLFLMGMLIFAGAKVQIVVLETGLGGRLDATNVVEHPLVCVITSMSLEHTEYLGDTLTAVTGEKAGIIKPGAAVVYEAFQPEVNAVIEGKVAEFGNKAFPLKAQMFRIVDHTPSTITFQLQDDFYRNTEVTIPFGAQYQAINASIALLVLKALQEKYPMEMTTICAGMQHARWQGRMETVMPQVIVDGAHNDDGVRRFIETAKQFEGDHDITLLFSAVVEKDYAAMIHRICTNLKVSQVVTTQISGDRVVPAEELAELFVKNGCAKVTARANIEEAFEEAYKQKGDGLLFCVGSLYLVGEIKSYLTRR